jgi:hypothetical protein
MNRPIPEGLQNSYLCDYRYVSDFLMHNLAFCFADGILQPVERKGMLKRNNSILIVTLLIIMVAAPIVLFAGGVAKFSMTRTLYVAGSELKAGTYDVKWEANSSEATVTFIIDRKVAATVKGKIVERPNPADFNSLMIGKDTSGRETISGLLFREKTTSIIFE